MYTFPEVNKVQKSKNKFTIGKLFTLMATPTFESAKKAWKNKFDITLGTLIMAFVKIFSATDVIYFSVLLIAWMISQVEALIKKEKTEFSGTEGFIKFGGYSIVVIIAYFVNILTKNALSVTIFSITITLKDFILYCGVFTLIGIVIKSLENIGVKVPLALKKYNKFFTIIVDKTLSKIKNKITDDNNVEG